MKQSIEEIELMRKRMWEAAREKRQMSLSDAVFYAFIGAMVVTLVVGEVFLR
jgi:hypothetical protein